MKDLYYYILEKHNFANNGDEFYTKEKDIRKVLDEYNFKGKIVYCNCDNPSFSNFWKVFHDDFNKLELKKLMATYYDDEPYLYEFEGKDIKKTKIESGRFQDNEKFMKQCDIVVTNPPYSNDMPIELANMLLKNKVDFMFVGPLHLAIKKEFFPLLKNGQIQAMEQSINSFERPDGSNKTAASCWWTNLNIKKEEYKLTKEYNEKEYPKYDNYDAINCDKCELIPKDYKGKIGVPYRFITHLNNDEFELIDYKKLKVNGITKDTRLIIQKKGTTS